MPSKNGFYYLFLVVVVLAFGLAWPSTAQAEGPLYVKPIAKGSGDCTSWDNACTLQTALAKAGSGKEIWVAKGTHLPTARSDPADPRTATFQLKSGVALYGGFAGTTTETSRDQRDWVDNPTILSGDIGTVGDKSDNSYHVVTGSGTDATAILDGFTVSGGNANGSSGPHYHGSGMYNYGGSPTVRNVTFSDNSATFGGGMENWNSSPTLTNVTFSGNSATFGFGGGMENWNSSPTLVNVTFSDNSASSIGGGMYNKNSSSPTLVNVTFSGNSAAYYGGGMHNQESSPTLVNVTFSGNSAHYGGGMENWENSSPTLVNVTFSGNSASSDGGGMDNRNSSPTLANCILWGNTAPDGPQIYNGSDSSSTISYSLVQGSGGSGTGWDASLGTDGGGNLDEDPLFLDPPDNLRLQSASPAIDAGDNSAVPDDTTDLDGDGVTNEPLPFDLGGQSRIQDGDGDWNSICDMGAYEALTIGAPGMDNGTVKAIAVDSDGNVYVGGDFQDAGGVAQTDYIARWNDLSGWSPLGGGVNGQVKAIAVAPNGDVYVGGDFEDAGGVAQADYIARWNDLSGWSSLGGGVKGPVKAIAVDSDGDVYVGGDFQDAGDVARADYIARWNGGWKALGGGVDGPVNTIAVAPNSDVYVGGEFLKVDAADNPFQSQYIARWDGNSWHSLGDVLQPAQVVDALATNGDELYLASRHRQAGGFHFFRVALDGMTWTEVASSTSDSDRIYAVAASQHNIFAGGKFGAIGGVPANWIAYWNSQAATWSAIVSGVTDSSGPEDGVHALALDGPSLYAGGTFTTAGGGPAGRFARWLQPMAELAVFGSISPPDPVYAGQRLTYQITVQHNGYAQATHVRLVDILPEQVTFVSATPDQGTCSEAAGVVTCALGELTPGASTTASFLVTVPATTTTGTTLTNVARVTAAQYDPEPGNNHHTQATTVTVRADLSLDKRAPATADVGQELTYTLTVTNAGPSTASRVMLTDTLPSGVSFKTASPGYVRDNATVTWHLEAMPASGPDSVKTLSITVVPYVVGELENQASVSAPEAPPIESVTATTMVSGTIGLSIGKTDEATEVGLNEPLTYIIRAWNFGDAQVTGVRITDTLPVSVTFRSVTASQGSCTGTTTIICELGTLQASESATVTLGVTATAVGQLVNTAWIGGDWVEPDSSTDDDTEVKNEADLSLAMTGPSAGTAGQAFDYAITIVNHGPASTTGVRLSDDLPDGLRLNSATATPGTCTSSDPLTCDIGPLANGGSAVVTINVTPLVTGTFKNTASVTSAKTDPDPGNNQQTVQTTVTAGTPVSRTVDGLTITAYVFEDLGGGQTRAYGVTSLGEHFYLDGPNDSVTFGSSSLTGSGTLALKAGQLPIFSGSFSASAPDWKLTLGSGTSVVPHLAGFAIDSSTLTGVNLLSGQVSGSTTSLRLDPPGISATVAADFTIMPGPEFSGTIRDEFTLTAGAFTLQVPASATLSNTGVTAKDIELVMPAYFGGGVVPDVTMHIYYSPVTSSTPRLELIAPAGEDRFSMPELRFDKQTTLKITNGKGRLINAGGAYAIEIVSSTLKISLPGNREVTVPPSNDKTLGVVWLRQGQIDVAPLPAFTLNVAGATLEVEQASLVNDGLSTEQAVLRWPDNLGGMYGNVPDVDITPDGRLTIANGAAFELPDIQLLGGGTLRVNGPAATLVEETAGYSLDVQSGSLRVRLPQQNDRTMALANGRVDTSGHFSGTLQQATTLTLDVAAADLTLGGLSLNDSTGLSASWGTWQLPTLGGGSKSFSAPIVFDGNGLHINGGNPVDFPDARLHQDGYPLLDNRATLVQASDHTYELDVSGTLSVTIPGASSMVPANLTLDSLGNFNGSAGGLAMGVGGLIFKADGLNVQNGRPHILGARLAAPAEFGGDEIILDQMSVLDADTDLDFGGDGFAGEVNLPSLTALGANMFELAGSFTPVDRLPVGNPDGVDDGYEITGHGLLKMPSLGFEDDGKSKPSDSQDGDGISCSGIQVDIRLIIGEAGNTILTVYPTSGALVPLSNPAPGGPQYLLADDLSLRMIETDVCLFCTIPLDATGLQLNNLRGGFTLDRDLELLVFRAGFTIETVASVPVLNAPLAAGDVDATLQVTPDPQADITGTLKIMGIFEAARATAHIEPGDVRAQLVIHQILWIGPLPWPVTGTLGFHTWTDWGSQAHFTGWGSLDMSVPKGMLVYECADLLLFDVCLVLPPFTVPAPRVDVEFGEFRTDSSSVWGIKGEISVAKLVSTGVYIDANGTVDFGDVDSYVLLDSGQVLRAQQAWLGQAGGSEPGIVSGAALEYDHRIHLPLVMGAGVQQAGPAPVTDIEDYDLFAFNSNAITRTVPVTTPTDMAFMLSRSSAVPTLTLVSPSDVEITPDTSLPGVVHWETYTQTVDINGNTVPITQTTYIVKQAEAGDWQVVLHGDITPDDRYVLGVVGSNPMPTLNDVSATSTGPTSADVSWRLVSDEITTTLNIYATSGPITATYTVTHTDGTTESVTRPVYSGLPVAVDVPTPLNGALHTHALDDMSDLESGTYWIWVEANDQTNAPVRAYAPDPIAVDNNQSWPLTWTPNITVTPEYLGLHIAWDRLAHPDADGYRVYVSDTSLTEEPSLGHTTVFTTQWLSTFVNTWLEPGRTHYVAVEAYDEDSGRTVRSPQVTGIPRAAEFELTTPTPAIAVTGGSATTLDVLVTRTGDVTPTVSLYAGVLPDGLDVTFTGSRWVTPTLAGTPVSLVISATDTMPGGTYQATIVAFGGGASRTLDLQVTVNEPYFELTAAPSTVALGENESAALTISATSFNGESDPIHLELEDAPSGLLWSLSSDVVHPGGSVTLAITDTFLVAHGKYDLHVVGDDGENEYDLVVPLDVIEPRFGLATAEPQLTVTIGHTAVFTLEVTAEHGWADPVTLTLDPLTLPPASTAGFAIAPDDLPQTQLTVTPPQTVYLILETDPAMPEDVYLLTVKAESGDRQASLDLTLLAFAISDPPIVEAGSDQTVNEGDTVILDPATFTDPDTADIHTATVDWGDGTAVEAGIVEEMNGTGTVSGSHVYADNGSYTVTVTVCDNHATCGGDSLIVTVNNVAPTASIDGAPATSPIGTPINLTSTVRDPGSADTFTYAWQVTKNGTPYASGDSSSFSFTPDDSGTYLVSLTVTDDDGGVSPEATASIEVGNMPPDITSVTPSATEINEGDTITLVTNFTDPGADTHTAVINWGDGISDTLSLAFGDRTFEASHQYLDDDPSGTSSDRYTIQVTVTDDDNDSDSATTTVTVNNVAPTARIEGAPATSPEGTKISLTSTVSDPGSADTFTYAWQVTKNGNPYASGTHSSFSFTPDDNGTYLVSLTVTDDDGGVSPTASASIEVFNVAPTAEIVGAPATSPEGTKISLTSTVSDPGSADTFTYAWQVTKNGNRYASGARSSFSFRPDDNGTYLVTLTVTDDDGGVSPVASASIRVTNVAPRVGPITAPTKPVVVGTVVNASAPFRDAGLLDTHTAVWDWGDGASTPGTLTQGAGSGSVKDRHTYKRSGRFTIRLTVTDDDGGKGSATHTLTVLSPSEAIESLIDQVEGLNLPHGLENELTSKLNNALDDLSRGQNRGAVGKLNAFINSVKAQRGKKISAANADALIQTVQEIINAINAGLR